MRELIHYGTLHHFLQDPEITTPQVRIAIEYYLGLLRTRYISLTEELLQEHERSPFHRIYLEGVYKIPELITGDHAVTLPARALMERGVSLEATEHRGVYLMRSLEPDIFTLHIEKLKLFPKEYFLNANPEIPEWREILEDFFKDLEYADINAAREYWIGRNIAATLQEGERALLFLGKGHNPDNIKKYLTSDTKYTYIDLFPEIN
ncbi:MAG: hypothetical protein Q8R18_05900 [bacterium]|nr:hypothetical protein [bacterium]